jgi:pimeloyl-ACP methyl ester carboxylesterase
VRDVERGTSAWREAGSGAPVVFLHGLGGSRTAWDPQLRALADTHRCIAWDAPGYGAAPALVGAWTFDRLVAAVASLLADAGESSAHVVGHSLGGMIAQHLAVARPALVRSLTLVATSPAFGLDGTTTADSWRAARLAPLDDGLGPPDIAERVLAGVGGPTIAPDALAAQVAAMSRISSGALRQAIDCLVTHDTRAMLPFVTTRTLVLVGALDDETPASYAEVIADLVPGARLEVVPGAGHLLPADAPDEVNAALRTHLGAA